MSLGPTNARRQAKGLAERVAPRGSVSRSALRVARQVGRDVVDYLPRARSIWRLAAQPAAVEPDYREWLARTRVTPGQLVHQIELTGGDGRGGPVEIVVLPSLRAANGRAAAETIETLVLQTDPAWRAHVLAGLGSDDVESDEPRVTVVHLEGSDPLALADRL
ncbi:MAG TPA: hypothetical protein VIY72_12180, partial [Acidimicrobiales bacterium]